MCVFVVINILHEVSMSFLFYSSVAFNFTTYLIKKQAPALPNASSHNERTPTYHSEPTDIYCPLRTNEHLLSFRTNEVRRNLTSKTKSQGEKRRQEKDPSSKACLLVRDDIEWRMLTMTLTLRVTVMM